MNWLRFPVSATALLLFAAAACDGLGQDCTDIGCADGVMFDILPEDGHWEEGSYTLAVTLDDTAFDCEFQLPDAFPSVGSITSIECGALDVMFAPRVTCTETREGNSVRQTCTPIPDQYDLLLSAYLTPAESTITLSRDGDELLSDARSLEYEETFPNGEGCDPGCRQTRVVLEP